VRLLLKDEEEDDITTSNKHLRAVLVAIRAAGDLRTLPDDTTEKLLIALWRRLTDETSLWVGERVADAVQEWIRVSRSGLLEIVEVALEVLRKKPQPPGRWYAAQTYEDPDSCCSLLYQRDPAVRAAAVEKLAPGRRPVCSNVSPGLSL
jgi:hypothetical protein